MGRSTLYRQIRASTVPYRKMPTGGVRFTDQDIKAIFDGALRPVIPPHRRAGRASARRPDSST